MEEDNKYTSKLSPTVDYWAGMYLVVIGELLTAELRFSFIPSFSFVSLCGWILFSIQHGAGSLEFETQIAGV